jgi:hypothetical protein
MESHDVQRQQVLGGGVRRAFAITVSVLLTGLLFLKPDAGALEPEGASGQSFAVAIPELDGPVTLGVFTKEGTLVRLLYHDAPVDTIPSGLNGLIMTWDGKDDRGRPVLPGTYRARGVVHGSVIVTALPPQKPLPPSPPQVAQQIPAKPLLGTAKVEESPLPGALDVPTRIQPLLLTAAADALYEERPQVALLPSISGRTATLTVNGLPLINLPPVDGEISSAVLTQGTAPGEVTVTLHRSAGERVFTVTGLGQLVPLEAGTLEIQGDAFLSPSEHKE